MDKAKASGIDVVVVIATSMGRTDLLIERALPSVYRQEFAPLRIYVVDDNEDKDEFQRITFRVRELREACLLQRYPAGEGNGRFPTEVIRNNRTTGRSGSGAWNTAAELAHQLATPERTVYLALLDDDDEWYPNYLGHCCERVLMAADKVPAVVSGFHRFESGRDKAVHVNQEELTQAAFLMGNPGWQGSNTFVDTAIYWRAGGFDESMPSTLDRDFAIRVLDVCDSLQQPIAIIEQPLLRHHAHTGRRVTTGSSGKQRGLQRFYTKYAARMTLQQYQASVARVHRLFGYTPERQTPVERQSLDLTLFANEEPVELIIGVTSACPRNLEQQIRSLIRQLEREPQFKGMIQYVVLTNGNAEEQLANCLDSTQIPAHVGLRTRCIRLAEQQLSYSRFPYRSEFTAEPLAAKSIAHSRTLLQFFCWETAQSFTGPGNVLILDDDLLFETLLYDNGKIASRSINILGKLARLGRESRADMIISPYSDAPALPFYSSLRTQLLDIAHTLEQFSCEHGERITASGLNALLDISRQNDYYHDLSAARFDHLEQPVAWSHPDLPENLDSQTLFKLFLRDITCLGQEANITRPLLAEAEGWAAIKGDESYHRGGIAFYRDLSLLVSVPNVSPVTRHGGQIKRTRRSDFISTIYMTKQLGRKVEQVSIPLRHHRRSQNIPCELSASKLADDVIGACFYRIYAIKCSSRSLPQVDIIRQFEQLVQQYLTRLEISHLRVTQLLENISESLQQLAVMWSGVDSELEHSLCEAKRTIDWLKRGHVAETFEAQIQAVKEMTEVFDVLEHLHQVDCALRRAQ